MDNEADIDEEFAQCDKSCDANEEFYRRTELQSAEDAERELMREAYYHRIDTYWLRGLRLLATYDGPRLVALDCFYLAIGEGGMVGLQTITDISKRHYHNENHKATCHRIVKMFRDCLCIEAMPGQRGDTKKMSESRKEQLRK